MAVALPTDTSHLRLETRQYELFNVPLGQGVSRRRVGFGAVTCLVWWGLLAAAGLSPFWAFGPALFVVPPFAVVFVGTSVGDDGRMRMVRWYDAALGRWPGRRAPIGNPLLPVIGDEVMRLRVVTELRPTRRGSAPSEDGPVRACG